MVDSPNLNYIKEVSAGNLEFEEKFYDIIKTEFPEELNTYFDAMSQNDTDMAAKVVHKIKHKLGILSMNNAYQLAIDHEEALKNGNKELENPFKEVLDIVESFIKKIG